MPFTFTDPGPLNTGIHIGINLCLFTYSLHVRQFYYRFANHLITTNMAYLVNQIVNQNQFQINLSREIPLKEHI